MMHHLPRLTVPNLLGSLRFMLALILLWLAFAGEQGWFIPVLAAAFLLDAIDGPIARYLGESSDEGSRLDTIADFSVYMALVIGVWRLWPQIWDGQVVFIAMAAASMLLPLLVALMKFRTFTSYHTWLVKFATVCIALGSLVLLLGGLALPFRIAAVISVLGGLEQILITLILDRPRADVKHLVAVYRASKGDANR